MTDPSVPPQPSSPGSWPPAGATTPDNPFAAPGPGAVPPPTPPAGYHAPAYGVPQQGYGAPGQAGQPYGAPAYGYGPQGDGPPGTVRSTGVCILLTVVTFGIYTYVYNYKVHREMQQHSGRGVGGGVALLLTFLAGIAMPFVTPSEVGALYSRRGQPQPVSGWTGLWLVGPAIGAYLVGVVALLALAGAGTTPGGDDALMGAGVLVLLLCAAAAVAGAVAWFVKTNGALNRYWQSLGAR